MYSFVPKMSETSRSPCGEHDPSIHSLSFSLGCSVHEERRLFESCCGAEL